MRAIKQNIENLRYSIQWHSFDLTRDQQDALLLLLETLEQQLKQYESINRKGI